LQDRRAGQIHFLPAGKKMDVLPAGEAPDPLPLLHEQARRLLDSLVESGDREGFQQLNPFLALLVEAATKRGSSKPG
jgi:hypothetical protein